jgi:hypothetical protein
MTSTTRRAAPTALAGVPALAIPAVAVAEPASQGCVEGRHGRDGRAGH